MSSLQQSVHFLKKNTEEVKKIDPFNFLELLTLFNYKEEKNIDLHYSESEILETLGLTTLNDASSFLSSENYINQFRSSKNVLITEKFLSSIAASSGAGRHALTNNLQFKGIGRNILANQIDYSHSWGGYLPIDGLKAMIADKVCEKRTLNKPLKTVGLFLYEDPKLDPKQILALRENNAFRLSTFWPDILNQKLKKIGFESLEKHFNHLDQDKIKVQLVDQYIHAFANGVLHRTPVADNLTLTGQWIDTESIDFNESGDSLDPYLFIFVKGNPIRELKTIKDLKSLREDFFLTGSSMHDISLPGRMSSIVIDALFDLKQPETFKEIFNSSLDKYLPNKAEFYKLYQDHNCLKYYALLNESYDSLKKLKYKEVEFAENFECGGQFYDIRHKGTLLYFTKNGDISQKSKNILEKFNLAVTKDNLSFHTAFKNAKILDLIT